MAILIMWTYIHIIGQKTRIVSVLLNCVLLIYHLNDHKDKI